MLLFIIIVLLALLIFYLVKNRIHIRIDTFFRKGFKRIKDKYGIYCFCGKQGDGKTYSLVDMVTLILKDSNYVICNIKSLCERNEKGYYKSLDEFISKENILSDKQYIYEKDFNKIAEFLEKRADSNRFIIIYDEIFALLEKGEINKESRAFLSQMRKRGIYLYTTCQEWLELNITFRRYVRYQVNCKMWDVPFFNFCISITEVNDAYQMKWDKDENEYIAPRIQTNIKKCSKKIADSYDTFETIETQGKMTKR